MGSHLHGARAAGPPASLHLEEPAPGLLLSYGNRARSVCAHQNPEDHERDKNQVYAVSDGNRPVS
jgi:hypothetical protein